MRRLVGTAILLLGLVIAVYPAGSVWRVSGEAVAMAPDIEQLVERNTALFPLIDGDFILGTARYEGVSEAEVSQQLVAAGFDGRAFSEERGSWQTYECCGEFDALLARATDAGDGTVLVEFSALDTDVQALWWFFTLVGAGIAFIGAVLLKLPGQRTLPLEVEPAEQVPVS